MTTEQEKKIRQHGENLQAIFPATKDMDPIKLCKKLRRLESQARRVSVEYCNGGYTWEQWDARKNEILGRVWRLINPTVGELAPVPVFCNADGRGYALKIDDAYMREHNVQLERDMGGYGLIAPEIN